MQIERYLKMKLLYLLVNLNFGQASPIVQSWNNQRVELEAKSSLTWDMTNVSFFLEIRNLSTGIFVIFTIVSILIMKKIDV